MEAHYHRTPVTDSEGFVDELCIKVVKSDDMKVIYLPCSTHFTSMSSIKGSHILSYLQPLCTTSSSKPVTTAAAVLGERGAPALAHTTLHSSQVMAVLEVGQ